METLVLLEATAAPVHLLLLLFRFKVGQGSTECRPTFQLRLAALRSIQVRGKMSVTRGWK